MTVLVFKLSYHSLTQGYILSRLKLLLIILSKVAKKEWVSWGWIELNVLFGSQDLVWFTANLGTVYMKWASPVSRVGPLCTGLTWLKPCLLENCCRVYIRRRAGPLAEISCGYRLLVSILSFWASWVQMTGCTHWSFINIFIEDKPISHLI